MPARRSASDRICDSPDIGQMCQWGKRATEVESTDTHHLPIKNNRARPDLSAYNRRQ